MTRARYRRGKLQNASGFDHVLLIVLNTESWAIKTGYVHKLADAWVPNKKLNDGTGRGPKRPNSTTVAVAHCRSALPRPNFFLFKCRVRTSLTKHTPDLGVLARESGY